LSKGFEANVVAPVFLGWEAVQSKRDFLLAEIWGVGALRKVWKEEKAEDTEGNPHCAVCGGLVLVGEEEGKWITDDENPLPTLKGRLAV
jgi:hypothetical protein